MRLWAVSASTPKRPGWRAITSSVFAPTEPVDPRMHTRWKEVVLMSDRIHGEGEREDGQQRVDAIEHAAVAGQQVAAVLGAGAALGERLDEIAHHAHCREEGERGGQAGVAQPPAELGVQAGRVDDEPAVD